MRPASPRAIGFLAAAFIVASCAAFPEQAQLPDRPSKLQKFSLSAIQIEEVDSGDVKIPPEFRMALYENLIQQLRKTGKFEHVYRSGERGANSVPHLLVLRTRVQGFKKGSERMRQVTTVSGATSIKVRVQIADRDGRLLVDRDVQGKVRFFGDNLRATHNLSKHVAKIVRQTF